MKSILSIFVLASLALAVSAERGMYTMTFKGLSKIPYNLPVSSEWVSQEDQGDVQSEIIFQTDDTVASRLRFRHKLYSNYICDAQTAIVRPTREEKWLYMQVFGMNKDNNYTGKWQTLSYADGPGKSYHKMTRSYLLDPKNNLYSFDQDVLTIHLDLQCSIV